MRIIIFFDSYDVGGAEKHALKLADFFKNTRNYEVEVWVMTHGSGDAPALHFCRSNKINTRVIGNSHGIQRILFYNQILQYVPQFRAYKPDAVISFNVNPNLINGLIAPFIGSRYNIWSQQSENHYVFTKKIDRWAVSNISHFVSNSYHGLEKLQQFIPIPDAKKYVIPNGIEQAIPVFSKQQWLERIGLDEKTFKAVMTANLTNTKDHVTLLYAWKIVVEELKQIRTNACLVLPGRLGSTAQTILSNALELGIYPNIKILGSVNDVHGLNAAMDIGILSSPAEGMPNGLMENMLAGIPVAGTDIPGIKEVVGESNYQYLAPVGDFETLAQKILLFATNASLRAEVGRKNMKRIEEEFSLHKMCIETENILLSHLR